MPNLNTVVVEVSLQFSANEDGVIDSVEVIEGYNVIFDREAVRVIKSVPEWDVWVKHGKPIREYSKITIEFSEANRKEYNER